jgi:glycosyltransferase involved in cell wall biosynthesis
MADGPQLSVVIASYNSRKTIGACLESLRNQKTQRPFEVIVVDSSSDGTADLIAAQFPEVHLVRFASRRYPGTARNAGIEVAAAPIVAFTDADCVAREDYVEALLEAHRDLAPAIGGAIANLEPANAVSWAAYLCEFSEWMPWAQPSFVANLATANASYRAWVFEKYGPFLEGTYGSDTDFNSRLMGHGHRLLWSPAIHVSHRSIGRLGSYLRHELAHGTDCCRMRIRALHFSLLRRWTYALLIPLIFLKLFARVAFRVVRSRKYLGRFLQVSPLVAFGLAFWCCGEFAAFLRPAYGPDRNGA